MTVGLNAINYYVTEDSGVVTVCVEVIEPKIDFPVSFPFNVKIQTFDDTAGTHYCLHTTCHLSLFYNKDLMILHQSTGS